MLAFEVGENVLRSDTGVRAEGPHLPGSARRGLMLTPVGSAGTVDSTEYLKRALQLAGRPRADDPNLGAKREP